MSEPQVVVTGAGPSRVSIALALKDVGVRPLVLDQADRVGSSWRSRYDRLRLNTCRPNSHLPDRRFPKGTPMFPSRDEVIEPLVPRPGALGYSARQAKRGAKAIARELRGGGAVTPRAEVVAAVGRLL